MVCEKLSSKRSSYVGPGGVVDDELAGGDDRLAAILIHAVDAVVAERHQHVILAGAGDPRRRSKHPLRAGIDARKRGRPDRGLRHRAPKPLPHVGVAIETDKSIADDVLPDRKTSIRDGRTGVEHDSHDGTSGNPSSVSQSQAQIQCVQIACRARDWRRFGYQLVKQRMAFYEAFEGVELHIAMHNIGGLGIRRLLEGYHEEFEL
jgi:hypothetical protein